MRINRRPSGGRGEYEISGALEGVSPHDLENHRLVLQLSDSLSIESGTELREQGGKLRLRRLEGTDIQLHLQFAAAMLMPKPVRDARIWGDGAPVMQQDRYGIVSIDLAGVALHGDTATLTVRDAEVGNAMSAAESIGFERRLAAIERVWKGRDKFPETISQLLQEHEQLVRSGQPLPRRAQEVVHLLQGVVARSSNDLGILGNAPTTDVLPSLEQVLGDIVPAPVLGVDEIPPVEQEIRKRNVKEWKRWAACRGAESAKFRRAVREAYNATCMVCGLCFPPTDGTVSGVDAAHVLPWSEYELDHVSNGVCLCKQHHWAFDEGLLQIEHDGTNYVVTLNDDTARQIEATGVAFSLEYLRQYLGPITAERLPRNAEQWPNRRYLEKLKEAIY